MRLKTLDGQTTTAFSIKLHQKVSSIAFVIAIAPVHYIVILGNDEVTSISDRAIVYKDVTVHATSLASILTSNDNPLTQRWYHVLARLRDSSCARAARCRSYKRQRIRRQWSLCYLPEASSLNRRISKAAMSWGGSLHRARDVAQAAPGSRRSCRFPSMQTMHLLCSTTLFRQCC